MTIDLKTSRSHLSSDLETLHDRLKGKSLTVAELKQALKGRGSAMLLVLLALPFCFIAIPGLSMPFGIAICLIGGCLVIGREPWLPRFIMRWRLSNIRLAQLLSGAIKMARRLERHVRPRLAFLHTVPGMQRLIGLGIIIAGLALMLPLPIPFTNTIPSLGDSLSGNRDDGEGRLVCLARPFNCYSVLDLYRSDFGIRSERVPWSLECFLIMKSVSSPLRAAKTWRILKDLQVIAF